MTTKRLSTQSTNIDNVNTRFYSLETQGEADNVDLANYKGIYFGEDNKKFQDDSTGAHFDHLDMCRRLKIVQRLRKEFDDQYAKE